MDVKITVLVTEELRRKAKAAAALQGVTLSEIVRQALEQFVEDFGPVQGGDPSAPAARGPED
jgi:predicted HicB family RNase H-like nuclease